MRCSLASESKRDLRGTRLANGLDSIDILKGSYQLASEMLHIGSRQCYAITVMITASHGSVREIRKSCSRAHIEMGYHSIDITGK